jgi:PAS domain S-box-containing protein
MAEKFKLSRKDLFDLLVSQLSEFVIVLADPAGYFISWHPGVEAHFGYSQEEFIGQHLETLLPREERGWGIGQRELDKAAKTGQRMLVEGVTIGLRDLSGELAGFGKVLRDVTEQLRMRDELETANSRLKSMAHELERSNEDLEEFARIASHDLSAPLTSTQWLVELLLSKHAGQLDAQGQNYVKQISKGLERMTDLVEGVLAHAQVGRTAIASSKPVKAEESLYIALDNLRQHIETSGASVSHDPLPEVRIEQQALNQLLQNLLSNAIKYRRPEVEPVIRVSAARQGATWLFEVTDNGLGIPRDWFERIFQPMQRAHGEDIAGSGIGLATCKKIVTRAGGSIWVDSEVGRGSTFFFTLPGRADQEKPSE